MLSISNNIGSDCPLEAGKVLGEMQGALVGPSGQFEGEFVVTEEEHLRNALNALDRTLSRLLTRRSETISKALATALLWNATRLNLESVRMHFPMHRLSPAIELLQGHMQTWLERGLLPPQSALDELTDEVVEANCMEFVRQLRRLAASTDLKHAQANFRRKFNKNHAGLIEHLQDCARRCRRLLAIRLDLSYRKNDQFSSLDNVSFEEVQSHRRAFLRWMKSNFAVAGYAWRLEYGLLKGPHYHFLLLLNGSRHQRDVSIAKMAGVHWSKEITQGRGIYWNCNADQYRWRGIGMIEHRETQRFTYLLERVAPYLTKPDEALEYAPPKGGRTFGRSTTLKLRNRPVGRPRSAIRVT